MFLSIALVVTCCDSEGVATRDTLRNLFRIYKSGEISECMHEGRVVYVGVLNAFDAGSTIYDLDGNIVGRCFYAWGGGDPICQQLMDCDAIYRGKDNISGRPEVDKYRLRTW